MSAANRYLNQMIAREISRSVRYYDAVYQWRPTPQDQGQVLNEIQCRKKIQLQERDSFPDLSSETHVRSCVLLHATLNHDLDIQKTFLDLKAKLSRSSRIIAVLYNPYLSLFYRFANLIGIRTGPLPTSFVTRTDLAHIAELAGFEVVRIRNVGFIPWKILGLGSVINWIFPIIPGLKWLAWSNVIHFRPMGLGEKQRPSLSVVIPARNERGNIQAALERMPDIHGIPVEIIFVEGHSTDGTWEEVQRVSEKYKERFFKIQCHQQTGKGKRDAVHLGFQKATGDLITILDADLTMPPEMLVRFYDAYCSGMADFINGTRLVYPMEGQAMRFLNRLGNVFFAKALSYVLDTSVGDSLCGTKLLLRQDYHRFLAWKSDFGEFDPFGDFELLFPASVLGLGTVDIPIRYRARTYGSTNINRFEHGWMLLKMTLVALFRIKIGAG